MPDTFAIYALHRKRAHLAGEIQAAQTAINKQRDTLATLDAVIRLFEPDSNPELIPAIRPASRRCLYFRHGEQKRLCLAALREASKPVSVRHVTDYALAAKGLNVEERVKRQITERVRQSLALMAGQGIVRKLITWPDTWWELAV